MTPIRQELFGLSPWVVPGLFVTILVSTLLAGTVARRLLIRPCLAWALLASAGGILSLTMTPHPEPLGNGAGLCDLSLAGLPGPTDLGSINTRSLNVLLFVPLGLSIGLLPWSGRKIVLGLVAFGLPVAIELTQGAVTVLHRACQGQDVVDNLSGLVIGLAVASIALLVTRLLDPGGQRPP